MIQAAIAGLILLGIYKFIDRNRVPEDFDPQVDWWAAFVFVFVPSVLIFLLAMALGIAELPSEFIFLGYVFYFIVPYSVLKFMLEFKTKRAVIFSIFVPVVAVGTEVLFVMLMRSPNA